MSFGDPLKALHFLKKSLQHSLEMPPSSKEILSLLESLVLITENNTKFPATSSAIDFWIAEGLLECEDLIVKRYAEFVVDYSCLLESLEDVGSIKAQIVYCPYCPPDEIPTSLTFEFAIDDSVEEEDKLAEMLGGNYKVVFEALQNGETIDDDWLSKH